MGSTDNPAIFSFGSLHLESEGFRLFRVFTRPLSSCLDGKMLEEKRSFRRFKGGEGAFAAFIVPDRLINMGHIIDISMGGLCIQYLSFESSDGECSTIKIFGANDRFIHLDKVRCRIVYVHEIPECSYEQIRTRRCGVEFQDLSVKHLSILRNSSSILPAMIRRAERREGRTAYRLPAAFFTPLAQYFCRMCTFSPE